MQKSSKELWVEIVGNKMNAYSLRGRALELEWDFTGGLTGSYTFANDASDKSCFTMSHTTALTRHFCAESEGTAHEWMRVLQADSASDTCVESERSAAAWITFGLEAQADVDIKQDKFLCVNPDRDFRIQHMGTLETTTMFGAFSASTLTAGIGGMTSIVNTIVAHSGLLRPMQIWNLNVLGKGFGLNDPHLTVGDNYIALSGTVVRDVDPALSGSAFSRSLEAEENACIPEAAEEDGGGSWMGFDLFGRGAADESGEVASGWGLPFG